jgi:hypothetical protein
MATLTPAQAQDMIYRSMLTGVPTSEFEAAGGYDAVSSLAKQAGGDMGRPSDAAIQKYGPPSAAQGYGNTSYAPGATVNDSALAEAGYDNYYDQATKKPSTSYLQKQIAALQTSYNALVAKNNGTATNVGSTGGATVGGGTVIDAGGSTPAPSNTGATSGVVYGPDGVMYSSAAAAIAAGVNNYSTTKPAGLINTNNTLGGQFTNAAAGNVNPGGLIGNAQQQLFQNPVTVQGPSVKTTNPFATTPR